ncbi:MAG: hypothetical protein LRZ84_27115 [Desertifilum sp.]|nr:hypothetical protein [Desertifilum sp.]
MTRSETSQLILRVYSILVRSPLLPKLQPRLFHQTRFLLAIIALAHLCIN